jgi:hypothetical protein
MPFDKRFWISFAAVFVVAMVIGFINHGLLLAPDYEALTPSVMRTLEDQESKFTFQIFAHVLVAFGFVWLYREGRSPDKPWLGQGVRFGVAFARAAIVPIFLIYHAVAQFPLDLAIKQGLFDSVGAVILGVVTAFLNR